MAGLNFGEQVTEQQSEQKPKTLDVQQNSQGANSPNINIPGNNNTVNINPPTPPPKKSDPPPTVLVTGHVTWNSTDDTIVSTGQAIKMEDHAKVNSKRLHIIVPTHVDPSAISNQLNLFIINANKLQDSEVPEWTDKVTAYLRKNCGVQPANQFSGQTGIKGKKDFLAQIVIELTRPRPGL